MDWGWQTEVGQTDLEGYRNGKSEYLRATTQSTINKRRTREIIVAIVQAFDANAICRQSRLILSNGISRPSWTSARPSGWFARCHR